MRTPLTLKPLSPFGAELSGLDLRAALESGAASALAAQLRVALNARGLLVVRDQHDLQPAHHTQCAQLFGDIFPLPERFQHTRSPFPKEILRISNDEAEGFVGVGASGWHVDGTSYTMPFSHALMQIVQPLEHGGPTLFLPLSPLASRLRQHAPSWDRLWVRNGNGTHPLVYAHPRTRAPGVCLGKAQSFVWDHGQATERVTDDEETAATLAELRTVVDAYASDGRVYTHEWRAGDLVLVDNLAVAHLAPPQTQAARDEAGLRVLHRVVVAGVDELTPMCAEHDRMSALFSKDEPAHAQRLAARALQAWPEWRCEAYPASAAGRFHESRWWEQSGRERAAEERCLVTAGCATLWPEGGGPPVEIAEGDWATFRRGFLCEWVVHERISKRYAYFDAEGEELT
jgi:alpha-ketoglutarate-dependent taurine dioxygenase/uncharacterized cupin superfamily protein